MQRLIIRNIVSVLIFLLAVIILNRYDMFTVYTVVILFTIEVLYNIFSSYFFVIKPIEKMIKLVEETDWESEDIDFDKFDKLNSSSIFHLDVLIKNYQYLFYPCLKGWQGKWDSDSRMSVSKTDTLTTWLFPYIKSHISETLMY